MSYEVLKSLYFGEAANADLATDEVMGLLHVRTGLDELVPSVIERGLDVVLTGNPGDGKSHLVRALQKEGALTAARVELDLSARPTVEVVRAWGKAAEEGSPFVLCANEGPLLTLLDQLPREGPLGERRAELLRQVRRLVVPDRTLLPLEPKHAMLVDLADRNVLEESLIRQAIGRVCDRRFLPPIGVRATATSAGRNILLLSQSQLIQERLARILAIAGRRLGEHVTFRQLWACISYAVTAAKSPSTLRQELSRDDVGADTYPLDNLMRDRAEGALIQAVQRFGDAARVTIPELDEEIWSLGRPRRGVWLFDDDEWVSAMVPARQYESGDHVGALELHARLKRLVALTHEAGADLVEGLDKRRRASTAEGVTLATARRRLVVGLRRFYLDEESERSVEDWLQDGLPLWVSNTYQAVPANRRPHVCVASLPEDAFSVQRPVRPPWLSDALGPLPDFVWLRHNPSGVSLHVDSDLLALLTFAGRSAGPLSLPEPVERFLTRLAGWEELHRSPAFTGEQFTVIFPAP